MAQTSQNPPGSPTLRVDEDRTAGRRPSAAWQGWAYFGAVVMVIAGFFQAILGVVVLVERSYFTFRENSLLALGSYATWGWFHLVVGIAAVVAGIAVVIRGGTWARVTAVVVAGLSAVLNLGFLAASPVWSTLVITLDVVIIYALTVHGREIDST